MHDIAITIVNYNMRDAILACLQTLRADIASSNLDVVVTIVDNASSDNLQRVLANQFPEVRFIANDANVGFGRGNNVGLQSVKAKYYFVLNPDTSFVQPNTLSRLYDWMEREPKVGMIGPKLIYPDGTLQKSCFRFPKFSDKIMRQLKLDRFYRVKKRIDHFLMEDFDHRSARAVDWVLGSAMFVRAKALEQVGGFDDRFFMYFEDCDWCRRFWEAHWPVYYVPEITIAHVYARATTKTGGVIKSLLTSRLAREHVKSWWRYYHKWRNRHSVVNTPS